MGARVGPPRNAALSVPPLRQCATTPVRHYATAVAPLLRAAVLRAAATCAPIALSRRGFPNSVGPPYLGLPQAQNSVRSDQERPGHAENHSHRHATPRHRHATPRHATARATTTPTPPPRARRDHARVTTTPPVAYVHWSLRSSTSLRMLGRSVMMPSTPRSSRRSISADVLIVHTCTARPAR